MKDNETIFHSDLVRFFGDHFSISYKELCSFLEHEIELGIKPNDIATATMKMLKDSVIDYESAKMLLGYLGVELPRYFEHFIEEAKEVLAYVLPTTYSEHETLERLLDEYQNNRINFYVYEVCCFLLGIKLSESFKNLTDPERKQVKIIYNNDGTIKWWTKEQADFIRCLNGILNVDNSELFMPSRVYNGVFDFIYDYMDSNNINESILKKSGLDRRYKHRLKEKGVISKMDVFRFIFVLDMPTQIAKQFMTIAGYAFSPLNKTDLFFLNYLNGKYQKVKNLEELNNLGKNYCNENFEWPKWN